MEWQPIDTGPKDGTSVIVASEGGFVGEAKYWAKYWENYGNWWWANCHPTDSYDGEIMYARHWMPLPEPPK